VRKGGHAKWALIEELRGEKRGNRENGVKKKSGFEEKKKVGVERAPPKKGGGA